VKGGEKENEKRREKKFLENLIWTLYFLYSLFSTVGSSQVISIFHLSSYKNNNKVVLSILYSHDLYIFSLN
jgi:hypothetical protein